MNNLSTHQEYKILLMELQGYERYRIANRLDVTPSAITAVLRKPHITKLRANICDKVSDWLFTGEDNVNGTQ